MIAYPRSFARTFVPLILAACLLAACAAKEPVGAGVGGTVDTIPPSVSSTNPANGAAGVSTGATISVTFSEAMSAASVNGTTFTVNGVSGSVSVSGTVATLAPSSPLVASTIYTAAIMGGASGVKDAAGNSMVSSRTWTFTTAAPPVADTTPPTVSSTNPANGATGVSTGATISVTFSEAMSAASVNGTTFSVSGASGSVSTNGATATFTPSAALTPSTTYTATIVGGPGGVKDAANNPLASNFSWTFTTGAAPSCASTTVHCVGPNQEFTTIQSAVNAAQAGHTVLVFDGTYAGFVVSRSGTSTNRITVRAEGSSAVINQTNSNGEGITISNASFVTVEGFTVIGMPSYGLATHNASATSPMRGVIIRNNTVQNSGFISLYASHTADSLIEGNSASGSATSHGIYLANGGSDNTIIRGNRCFNNAKNGIHLNGDKNEGGDGLHTGITIENNVIFGNTANGLDLDGIQDSLIRNNLIYDNGNHALRAFAIDAAAGPKNLTIVNNTFVVKNGGGWPIKIAFSSDMPNLHDLGGHTIFNNILVNNGGNGSIVVENPSFQSNQNIVKSGFSLDGEVTTISLQQWQAAGHDLNSTVSTSATLFTNPGSADFTLKSGAPAADAGVTSFNSVSAPVTDILGVARPRGSAYDIGAYESF